jgi:hypothetical protein
MATRTFVSYSYDPAQHDVIRASVREWLVGVDVTACIREVAECVTSPDVGPLVTTDVTTGFLILIESGLLLGAPSWKRRWPANRFRAARHRRRAVVSLW